MTDLQLSEWQMIRPDEWDFGVPIRGIVRRIQAYVYFDKGRNGWVWSVPGKDRGVANSLRFAIDAAEKSMGVVAS